MARYLIAYLAAAAAMAVLDVVWLRLAVKTLYEPAIGTLLSGQTNVAAAALFYVLYVLGILTVRNGARPARRWRGDGAGDGRRVRFLHLHDLRPDQHGDAEGVAGASGRH